MNPTPITGSVNEKGLFTAKNPYLKLGTGNPQDYLYAEFENEHPQLLTYTPSNVLVTDEEHVEVKPWWRYNSPDTEWTLCSGNTAIFKKSCGYEVEHCYITIPPTELTEAKPFKAVDEPDAQPLEGVKTQEEIAMQFSNGCAYEYDTACHVMPFKEALKAMEAYHAQFATDAGGGFLAYRENIIAVIAYNFRSFKTPQDRFNIVTKIREVKAPSTHSSSEMVEEWINVKDGLPEHMVKVWVYISSIDKQCEAIYYRNVKCWRKDARFDLPVTNWRPLTYPK